MKNEKKNEKKNNSINWIAIIGFFIILSYLYLVFATYTNLYPWFNEKLSDDYIPFEDPTGNLGVSIFSSFTYLLIKLIVIVIFGIVIIGLIYCGKEFINAARQFIDRVDKKLEENDKKTTTEETDKKRPDSERNR